MGASGTQILIASTVTGERKLERLESKGAVSLRFRWALIVLFILALLGGAGAWGTKGLGRWLVVSDRLEPARAIVVLSGHVPFRAMEAATIFRQRWAPEVWVTRSPRRAELVALGRLGIAVVNEETYTQQVLEHLGVPAMTIHLIGHGPPNTAEEVRLIAAQLKRVGGDQVILVTSKAHSRRVRATWHALVGNSPRAIVRYATEDPYDPDHWWRRTGDALAVSREVFGLMNVWAGFPVQPDRGSQ